jgi:hypothetical protein
VASALRLWPSPQNYPIVHAHSATAHEGSVGKVPPNTRRVNAATEESIAAEMVDLGGRSISASEAEERRNSHGFPDLAPIAECPAEVVPEHTPETSTPSREVRRGSGKVQYASEMVLRESSSSCSFSTDVPSLSVNVSSATDSPIAQPRQCPTPFLHRRSRYDVGCPVSFFVDGRPNQYFGRIRTLNANGTYTVDLVGGGRMAGLHAVTRCSPDDLEVARKSKRPVKTSDDPWAILRCPNALPSPRSTSVEKLPCGMPVTFSLEDYVQPFYGYMRGIGHDGCYIIDLVGGGRRTGVKEVTPCKEEDISKANNLRQGWRTGKDDYADINSPNAPSWGGGFGYTSGYRETKPSACDRRSLSVRASSTPSLLSVHAADWSRRSVSPAPLRQRRKDSSRDDLGEGCPVTLYVEGNYRPQFGRIRSIDADDRYTVDLVGGKRKVGVRTVFACSEADLEKEARTKQPLVTRKNAWDDVASRNRLNSEHRSPSPKLRGVAINLPPRSSTILCSSRFCVNGFEDLEGGG